MLGDEKLLDKVLVYLPFEYNLIHSSLNKKIKKFIFIYIIKKDVLI